MHNPKNFQQNDRAQLEGLIREYPFATLMTHSASGLEANHLPVLLCEKDGKAVLQAHIARANPLWKTLPDKSDVLVVFNGPNCYISPNHYPTKQETGKAVPTWNYVVVHVKGVMSYIQDKDWLLAMINRLTDQHEAGQQRPWSTADAPEEFIQKMLPAIVGLEIEISAITGQWKLSQNQPERNRRGVVAGLSGESGDQYRTIAELVKSASQKQAITPAITATEN
ncbi:transcriptional regulator [Marinobacterium aestuarii]|uniref:Transcriptional regulator n=2 Tax=Marinobacterium aestuarii TaxID=1821621 RepID=A0A1A9F5W6_9GAMM|nr:transcriptional regulator [Marinobacterium aestuarii]